MERRLAAILMADVVGYSRLMGEDEIETHAALMAHREELIDSKITDYHGHIVKLTGDGALVEFASVVNAVECAVDVQRAMAERNSDVPQDRRIILRIGINLGDVIVEEDDIYGDGVNVAARLEGLAEPGGICVSRAVRREVRDKIDVAFEDLGELEAKNIARPIHAYRVLVNAAEEGSPARKPKAPAVSGRRAAVGVATLALLLTVAGIAIWWQPWKVAVQPAPSMAVLPFTIQAGGDAERYFSDGLTEDVISALSRFSELTIVSRTTVFSYKASNSTPRQISRELGVRYLIDGSVRKSAERVRVSVRLSDAQNGVLLWSENFDEAVGDIFALQDKITHKIVGTLIGRLNLVEEKRAFAKPTEDLEAYDLALRGRSLFHVGERSANYEARALFEQAIERDPNYASAHIWLARTYLNDAVFGWAQWPHKSLQRSFDLLRKAISLDDANGISHALLAEIYTYRQRYDLAASEAAKAIKLNPSHADGHAIRGLIMIHEGQIADAIRFLETARRFNPRLSPDWSNMLGVAYFLEQRYDDAIGLLESLRVQFPEFAYTHVALAAVYAELGDAPAAGSAATNLRRLAPFFDAKGFSQQYLSKAHRPRFLAALKKAGVE